MHEIGIVLVLIIVLFVLGFFWPRRSRRAQEKIKDVSARAEEKVEHRAGKLGDWTAEAIDKSRWVTEESAHAGRKSHDKAFDSNLGEEQERELREKYGEGGEQGEGPADPYPEDSAR
jgi:hypothetical protein